jgi:hypothetical protein
VSHRPVALAAVGPALLALAASGCSSDRPATPVQPPASSALATPTYTGAEAAFAANVDPWSGLPSDDPAIRGRRPRVVALQAGAGEGLQAAEVVFVALDPALPGYALLTARAPTDGPTAGPIGEASWLHLRVAEMFDAALTAGSASPEVHEALARAGVAATMVLDGSRPVIEPAGGAGAAAAGPRWTFAEATPAAAGSATELTVRHDGAAVFGASRDTLLGTWRPSLGGAPLVDAATGEPVHLANVVLLGVPGRPDAADWWAGAGTATIVRDGSLTQGRWERAAGQPFALLDGDGVAAALRPGNTWFVLLPGGADIDVSP